MHINVTQLLKEPTGSSHSYQIDESLGMDDINSIKGEVTLIRTNRGLLARGEVAANVAGVCSRCLSSIDYLVNFNLEEEFSPSAGTSESLSSLGEPDSPTIDDSNVVDLNEVIRQYTLLTMPAKPLCRPDCAGICPSCGHDLNQGPCKCPSQLSDQRWVKLEQLGKEKRV
jgi:uncharacterized protein